jgi:multiple sugar transport system substrate-binding protein
MKGKAFKKMISLMLVFSLVFALAACTKSSTTEPSQNASDKGTSAPKSGENTTITFQTFLKPDGTSPREKALAQIVKNFTDSTGIQVKYVVLPWQDVDTQLMLSVQAGNPVDVSYVRDRSFQKHIEAGSLLSLDDYIKKDITDADKKDFLLWDKVGMNNGHKYTFPTSFIADALFIRKDLLEKAGLQAPKTWDDFVKVAKALNTPSVSGFMFGASPVQANQLDWVQSMIEGRGGKILQDDGKASFDSKAGIDTIQLLKSLVYDNKVMPASSATTKYDDVTDMFSSGRAAMIFEGSHRYAQIAKAVKPENLLVTKIPSLDPAKPAPAGVNGWTLGIPKNAKNPDAAWKFIKYFTSPESILLYTKMSGEIPIRNSILKDDFFKTPDGTMVNWYANYINEGSTLAVAPTTAQELGDIAANAIQEVLSDSNSNVEQILKTAAAKYNALKK